MEATLAARGRIQTARFLMPQVPMGLTQSTIPMSEPTPPERPQEAPPAKKGRMVKGSEEAKERMKQVREAQVRKAQTRTSNGYR